MKSYFARILLLLILLCAKISAAPSVSPTPSPSPSPPKSEVKRAESTQFNLGSNIDLTIQDNCTIYSAKTIFNKVQLRASDFKNIDRLIITDSPSTLCGLCDLNAKLCESIKITRPDQQINFIWKLCVGEIFIMASKSEVNAQSNNEEPISINPSFHLQSALTNEYNCSIPHETHNSFCLETKLSDCRTCKKQGCGIVECGNISNNKFVSKYNQ